MRSQSAALDLPSTQPVPATAVPAFARVSLRRETDAVVLAAWAELETSAPCSIYQTRAWLVPWIATLGRKAGITPFFVLAFGADDRPAALLCLGLQKRGAVRVATFLGGKDSNFNIGLLRPGQSWTAADLRLLLSRAARELGRDAPDAFLLVNQPYVWGATANPFMALPHQASPSAAFGTALATRAEEFFAKKLSKDSRKKLRKKESRLAEIGPLTHLIASAQEREAVLDCFFAQRLERFRAQNIASDFDDPQMRAFIETASAEGQHGFGIELHALKAGERIVAVYGGAAHAGQWSGMFNSFDAAVEIAKSSPGDLLLMKVIAAQCEAGLRAFDLGIGEARYKGTFCDEAIPLFDTFVSTSPRGWFYLKLHAASQRAKRMVKQNPRLFTLAKRFRALKPGA
ncbi:GNAT family N-acetyltransferase [Beijerinckia sp. L45]|uniref:GNAT family N-acetyltransferase n=1 Tax=Beijerinckia sp. L45 TaxID=1641855 RepID=UPI00131AFF50|nr:GNAT family N-acetyltransferase [Beijerinckia sp. L45]